VHEGRLRTPAATSYTPRVSWNFPNLPMQNDAGSDPEDLETYTQRSLDKADA
jgi:hypothetical protein